VARPRLSRLRDGTRASIEQAGRNLPSRG